MRKSYDFSKGERGKYAGKVDTKSVSMKSLEVKKWATPEEVESVIEEIRKLSKEDRWISLSLVAERADGQVAFKSTRTENRYATAAHFMRMAMNLMGFRDSAVD